jgi:hypothetical protein
VSTFHKGMYTVWPWRLKIEIINLPTNLGLFQIFVLVVVFGLYHGLIFLPAVLSLIGPKPYTVQMGDTDADPPNPNTNVELKKVSPLSSSQ